MRPATESTACASSKYSGIFGPVFGVICRYVTLPRQSAFLARKISNASSRWTKPLNNLGGRPDDERSPAEARHQVFHQRRLRIASRQPLKRVRLDTDGKLPIRVCCPFSRRAIWRPDVSNTSISRRES